MATGRAAGDTQAHIILRWAVLVLSKSLLHQIHDIKVNDLRLSDATAPSAASAGQRQTQSQHQRTRFTRVPQ